MTVELDRILTAGVDRGAAAGVAAIVVDRDGTVWEGAAGERSAGGGVAMTVDTVGAIFSMTKALTGAAAMQLVEQGRLDLDAPAGDVLSDLRAPMVLDGFDEPAATDARADASEPTDDGHGADADGATPRLRPAIGDVTLRHLLTHTSGYVYDLWNADMARWVRVTGASNPMSGLKASLRTPLAFDPGTRWEYGIGIDWVGLLVEEVTGQTLGEYFAEHLLGPLAMTSTAFEPSGDMAGRAAAIHARLPDGGLAPIELGRPADAEFESGGGGLFGTVGDYGRFIRCILNDGELEGTRVFSPETVDAMATNAMGGNRVSTLMANDRALSNDAELFPGEEKSWGLTFQIHEQAGRTGRSAGTLSWAGLANTYFWIDRAAGIGGAYMTQILPFADHASLALYEEVETAAYRAFGAG